MSYELRKRDKKSYPLAAINIIRREAEDLLLSNSIDQKGRDAFKFILSLANEKSDLVEMKKGESLCVCFTDKQICKVR